MLSMPRTSEGVVAISAPLGGSSGALMAASPTREVSHLATGAPCTYATTMVAEPPGSSAKGPEAWKNRVSVSVLYRKQSFLVLGSPATLQFWSPSNVLTLPER